MSQLATVIAGLLTIASIVCVLFARDISEWDARAQVKQFERAFGFTSGTVIAPDGNGGHFESWGVVTVADGGAFARAGVRGDDIPFDRHGYIAHRVLDALLRANEGEIGEFHVANAADWMKTNSLRRIEISPHRREP